MDRRHQLLPLVVAASVLTACADADDTVLAPSAPAFIVSGSSVPAAEFAATWPFAVSLARVSSAGNITSFCAGSVVAPRWVVTAAHCVADMAWHESNGASHYVGVGSRDLTTARWVPVVGHHVADGFDAATATNDIALLELGGDAEVVGARLPATDVHSNEQVRVAGWGATSDFGSVSLVLQATTLTVIDPTAAPSLFYARSSSSNVCSGDSGGPALNAAGELVGVHSFVLMPCGSFQGSGHTSVFRFRDWIREVAGLADDTADEEAPEVTGVTAQPDVVAVGTTVAVVAIAADAQGSVASMQASLDGGATWHEMTALDGAFDSPLEHAVAAVAAPGVAGMHDVCVRATDSASNTSTPACALLAVYDPDGASVVGNGHFHSPAGALAAQPVAAGDARIGFVSGYRRGASRPSGRTSFVFRAGDFALESDSYDFLVVTGNDVAMLRGDAVVAGVAVKFSIRASVAEQSVWLRVWWEDDAGEHTVYDTGGAVPLTTGRIVIQPPSGN